MQANQGNKDQKAALNAHRDPDKHKVRPGVMVIKLPETRWRQYLPHIADTSHTLSDLPTILSNGKVDIVEGGYFSDTRYPKKLQPKELQHSALESGAVGMV